MFWEAVNFMIWGIPSLVFLGGTLIYYYQDQLLYYPNVPSGAKVQFLRPQEFDIENFEEVFITTEDKVKIQAWMIFYHDLASVKGKSTNISNSRPTVLYFHGNAGNISHCLPNVAELMEVLKCNVLLVSYRGYGKSEGYPTEKGIQKDAEASLKYLLEERKDIDVNKIILFGRSLGGAVSIYLCHKHQDKIKALIVENTFSSIADMIDIVMPLISPLKSLATNKWRSIDIISEIKIPTLLLAGKKDELVPFAQMKLLHEERRKNYNSNVSFYSFEDGHHMDTWTKPGYYSAVLQFFQQNNLD